MGELGRGMASAMTYLKYPIILQGSVMNPVCFRYPFKTSARSMLVQWPFSIFVFSPGVEVAVITQRHLVLYQPTLASQ